jgi:hypothetical protein
VHVTIPDQRRTAFALHRIRDTQFAATGYDDANQISSRFGVARRDDRVGGLSWPG